MYCLSYNKPVLLMLYHLAVWLSVGFFCKKKEEKQNQLDIMHNPMGENHFPKT